MALTPSIRTTRTRVPGGDDFLPLCSGGPDSTANLNLARGVEIINLLHHHAFLIQDAVCIGFLHLRVQPFPRHGPHQGHSHYGDNGEQPNLYRQGCPQPRRHQGH